jgi:hypothetical protein
MNDLWNDLVGVSLAHRYVLEELLSATDRDAWYRSQREDRTPLALRVMRDDEERLPMWRRARETEHPNLVRVLDAGRTQSGGVSLLYLACEFPDEFLAGVLAGRPLTPAEAREALRAVLGGLRHLHARSIVHGAVDPEHIMAFGDAVKLQSDTWRTPRAEGRRSKPGPYDAPESARGVVSPACDMWSLGVTLHEMLTGKRPSREAGDDFASIPEPFATVIRKTLVRAAEARWTVDDVARYVFPGEPAPAPPPPAPASAEEAASGPLAGLFQQAVPMWGVPVLGLVAALGLGYFFLKQPAVSPKPAPPAVSAPAPSAETQGVASREDARWRVIAFTYMQRSQAKQKVAAINRKNPELKAEVFTPSSENGPFLVSLGGRMTRPEAHELLKQARTKGMPRDAFARNFIK